MNKKNQQLVVTDVATQLAQMLAAESFKIMKISGDSYSPEFTAALYEQYLAALIELVIADTLKKPLESRKMEDKISEAIIAFATTKHGMQEAVAKGFTQAFSKHHKKYVEYYCQVKLVPPSANKLVC